MKPAILLAAVCLPALASANPRALPFTYTTDTLVEGQVEIEQYVDLAPRKAATADSPNAWFLPTAFLTEIEIGLAERLELGLYMTFVPTPSAEQFQNVGQFPGMGNGLKQRLRYVFADLGEWPVDVGLYGELTENEREVEVEGKLLLQHRFGDVRVAANLSSEYEYYFASHQREVVLNPSAGITWEASAKLHLGIDSWVRSEYPMHPKPTTRTFGLGPAAYVGPAVMYNFGKLWWAVGAYVRVTDTDHTLQAGEPYGPLYVRSMVGYNL